MYSIKMDTTCRFLLRLLFHNKKIFKKAGRIILSNKEFIAYLETYLGWKQLHNGTQFFLTDLGMQLRDLYLREKLRERLGRKRLPFFVVAGNGQWKWNACLGENLMTDI